MILSDKSNERPQKQDVIKDIDELLQGHLDKHHQIVKTEIKSLTSAGENYGSQMLSVDVHLRNKQTNKTDILHLVAKMCPPNDWLRELFDTRTTFKKEIEFYNTIVPTMKEFQILQGASDVIDCFPECYGARVSLNRDANTIVDNDAVILLENLKVSNFQVVDRMKGFDLDTTKMLLNDLAEFHAVPIATKLLKPDVFSKRILPHLDKNRKFNTISEDAGRSVIKIILKTIKDNEKLSPHLFAIERSLEVCFKNLRNSSIPSEPFATINHNDFWVNNSMIKIENGKLVKNKMVDFQLIDYGSPGNDIVFFLYSSVQQEVLNENFDELIILYYEKFIKTLKGLKCDVTEFTLEKLKEEIDVSAKSKQFFHILVMLKHVLAVKGTVKDLSEITEEDILSDVQISEEYKKKVPHIAWEFVKRKWIYN